MQMKKEGSDVIDMYICW